ncbi:hypothetical protein [Roseiarcus sp.]|uniref:hypothetical protein n=1 Tax=Roseiarcus sp. TaxID=1969460 RepID=UPI003F960E49
MSEKKFDAEALARKPFGEQARNLADATKKAIRDGTSLLDLIMPNGKPMRDCTGHEMGEFGQMLLRESERKKKEEAATKK